MHPDRGFRFDRAFSLLLIAAALAASLTLADSYLLRLLSVGGCYAIAAIGYQRLFGELGVLSLAQGAFFAVGGYSVAILGLGTGADGLFLLPAAMALAGLLALAVAPAMLKLASHYFALASLAVAQLVLLAAVNLETLTGGANGLGEMPPLRIAGLQATAGPDLAATIWLGVALCAGSFWLPGPLAALRRHMLREAPLASEVLGLDTARWRLSAFVFAAACGGLGGGLYAQASGVVAPDIAELAIMVNILALTVIGGRGRVSGAIVGALILAFLPETLRFLGGWQLFAWGAAMLAMLIVAPGGLVGLIERLAIRWLPRADLAAPHRRNRVPPADVLRGEGLAKSFGGVRAVAGVSLEIRPGEILGLFGANGAGKTTLLNLLSGFERGDGGGISWRGEEIGAFPVHRRARLGIGRSFQIDQLPGDITALDAVAAGVLHARRLDAARAEAHVLLRQFGLAEQAWATLSSLPPATRRLVDIARCLALQPAILLLDEPTAGLTVEELRALANALLLLRHQGIGLLVVEHDLRFLLSLADRLICLDGGDIAAEGRPDELIARPELAGFFGDHGSGP